MKLKAIHLHFQAYNVPLCLILQMNNRFLFDLVFPVNITSVRYNAYYMFKIYLKNIEIIYPILSLFYSKFTSIFSYNYFSIHSNPLSIILNLFQFFFNINSRLSFPILAFLSLTILHQSSLIFFYLLVNHNTRLSF